MSTPRPARALALPLVAVVLAAGCTTNEPPASTLDPTAALSTYEPLHAAVIDALESGAPGAPWTEDGEPRLSGTDGRCDLTLFRAKSHQYLAPEGKFIDIRKRLDPVLEQHGFSQLGDEEYSKGGEIIATATDNAGAELRLVSEQTSRVDLTVPVQTAACEGEGTLSIPSE